MSNVIPQHQTIRHAIFIGPLQMFLGFMLTLNGGYFVPVTVKITGARSGFHPWPPFETFFFLCVKKLYDAPYSSTLNAMTAYVVVVQIRTANR